MTSSGRGRLGRDESSAAFAVLGLKPGASVQAVQAARRRLAKTEHPDAGGSAERMQRINGAADLALAMIDSGPLGGARSASSTSGRPSRRNTIAAGGDEGPIWRDHPSFVVEALPAETFEALRIVAAWLGEVIDDDPPYGLEMVFADPPHGWCRLDLVPDAGASTVSITATADGVGPAPDVEAIRDTLVDALNRIDWSSLDD